MILPEAGLVYFRVRGGHIYGWGHIIRSLNLARKIHKELGSAIEITFFTDGDSNVNTHIVKEGFKVHSIPFEKDHAEERPYWEQHEKADVLLTDLLDATFEYQKFLKCFTRYLICLDDLADNTYCADAVICGQLLPDYRNCKPNHYNTAFFLGPEYFVLGQGFRKYHLKEKTIPAKAEKILVTLGGGDTAFSSCLPDIITMLEKMNLLNQTLFAGGFSSARDVQEQLRPLPDLNIIEHADNMPELLYDADIAIIAGGFTKYELACVGTPGIVIPLVEHQKKIGKVFAEKILALYAGDTLDDCKTYLPEMIANLTQDRDLRTQLSDNGKKAVDGLGAQRVTNIVRDILMEQ